MRPLVAEQFQLDLQKRLAANRGQAFGEIGQHRTQARSQTAGQDHHRRVAQCSCRRMHGSQATSRRLTMGTTSRSCARVHDMGTGSVYAKLDFGQVAEPLTNRFLALGGHEEQNKATAAGS